MLGNLPPNGRFSRQILESALNLPAENGRWKIYLPFRLFETGVKWKILGEMADLRIYILYETQLQCTGHRTPVSMYLFRLDVPTSTGVAVMPIEVH